jgi:hypothetical protein
MPNQEIELQRRKERREYFLSLCELRISAVILISSNQSELCKLDTDRHG